MKVLIGFCFLIVIATPSIGQMYHSVDNIPLLLSRLNQATSVDAKLKLLSELSFAYSLTFQTDSSLFYASTALVLAEKYQLKSQMAEAHWCTGLALQRLGNHIEALTELNKALSFADSNLDRNLISEINYAKGYGFYMLKSYKLAIEHQLKNLIYSESNKLYNNILLTYNNLGLIYLDSKKLDSALYYFNLGLKDVDLPHYELSNMSANKNIGRVYLKQGKNEEGVKYIWISIKIAEKSKSVHVQNTALLGYQLLAELAFENKDYKMAIEYATKALDIATKFNITDDTIDLADLLFSIFSKMGNTEKSLEYMNLNHQANDLYNKRIIKTYRQALNNQLQMQRQRMDINLLNQENKSSEQQILWATLGLIGLSLIGVWLFYLYQTLRRQKKEIDLNNQLLEKKVLERTREIEYAYYELEGAIAKGQTIERKRISTDIHDHLGGILSSAALGMEALGSATLSKKELNIVKVIKNQIGDAYDEVRLLSHNLRPDITEKEGIKVSLNRIANRIRLLHHMSITMDLSYTKSLPKKIEFHLYFIATELLNNVVKHAQATKITLSLADRPDTLVCLRLEDNGIGFAASKGTLKNGIGLLNIQERLHQINGELTFSSENGSTVFEIMVR